MNRAVNSGLLSLLIVTTAWSQSTISDLPFELRYGSGPWGVLLPSYDLGSDAAGEPAYHDDLDNLGGRWELNAVRRFLGTRTSFETSLFYGYVRANKLGSTAPIDIPNPATGIAPPTFAGGRTQSQSDLNHYGVDFALRDTWRTQFGGLSAGVAFSYMAFDQHFQLDRNGDRLLLEDLDSDLTGGKAIFGWDGCLLGHRSKLDFAVGYFDLEADYKFTGTTLLPGTAFNQLSGDATTIELEGTTYINLKGCDTGLKLGVMYISDLPQIVHEAGVPAFLTTDDGVLINATIEILL